MATNRAVWFDIPVVDLGRAQKFYAGVRDSEVTKEKFGEIAFCVLAHDQGNGGCLVERPEEVTSKTGILIDLNADGRIRDAVAKVSELGGSVVEDVHSIGPHGFRAIVLDSEGKRLALHSDTDEG